MKLRMNRIMSVLLVLSLLVSLVPASFASAETTSMYGKTTDKGVRVRKSASTAADYWFTVDEGTVAEVRGTTKAGGILWYKVVVQHPDPEKTNFYHGYIHGDYFRYLTAEEEQAYLAGQPAPVVPTAAPAEQDSSATAAPATAAPATAVPTSVPVSDTQATGMINRGGGTNFRKGASTKDSVLEKLEKGVVVEILSIPSVVSEDTWYKVRYNGMVGYVMSPYITIVSVGTVTPAPQPTSVVTQAPVTSGNYAKLILSSCHLRNSPDGPYDKDWEKKGEVLPIVGTAVTKNNHVWYPVSLDGKTYYVRNDCVQIIGTSPDPTAVPVPVTPVPTPFWDATEYATTVKAGVNFWTEIKNGEKITSIPKGKVLAIYAGPITEGSYKWYYAKYGDKMGYIRSDMIKMTSATPAPATATPVPTPTSAPVVTGEPTAVPAPTATVAPTAVPESVAAVKTIKGGVNLWTEIKNGERIASVARNEELAVYAGPIASGSYKWYYVNYKGKFGYIRSDMVKVITPAVTPTPVVTNTPDPVVTNTPAPTATTVPEDTKYVQTTVGGVNFRSTPGGTTIAQIKKGEVLPLIGQPVEKKPYTWYPVRYGKQTGYLRNDVIKIVNPDPTATPGPVVTNTPGPDVTATPAPTTSPVMSSYVQTTMDKVNLRVSPDKSAEAKYQLEKAGVVMAFASTQKVGTKLWYQIRYSGSTLWVLEDCVKVMTQAEYEQYIGQTTVTPEPPVVIVGYVKTTAGGVNLRTNINNASIIGRVEKKGTVLPIISDPVTIKGVTWYFVKHPSLGNGYLHGDYVAICNEDGSATPTPAPGPTTTPSSDSKQEASYSTLKLGSTGTAVKALVAELKNQGFYSGDVVSTYNTAVENAVKAFQAAKNITVDGIAGADTQHALYGTVPIGQGDHSNLSITLYPAEKIDWFTGGIQSLWPKGANYKIYDVKTGIVWWAHRWSGFNHVDAEPLTAADTARLCKIYGVNKSSEIDSKNLYQRRPCLITIGTRTFACSLYGIPHNYPDGDTIPNNDFRGQLCIHFTGSKTSESQKVDSGHQAAIEEAWLNAPNGHK